ncbi:hypothetical protein ACLMJK_003789 [Lecanora helva]
MALTWGPDYHRDLENMRKIGEGGEGIAFLMKSKRTKKLLVCKVSKKGYPKWKNTIDSREAKILDLLGDHPRILKMLYYEITVDKQCMAFYEYYAGGDLRSLSGWGKGSMQPHIVLAVFKQLAAALAFLHHGFTRTGVDPPRGWQHIIHCDVKPENIFLRKPLTQENSVPDLVLGDFGFANATENGISQEGGTFEYAPPEFPLSTSYGDIWALGSTIHQMVHNHTPFVYPLPNYPGGIREWMKHPKSRNPQPFLRFYDAHEFSHHMMQCLRRTPSNRIRSDVLVIELRTDESERIRRRRGVTGPEPRSDMRSGAEVLQFLARN